MRKAPTYHYPEFISHIRIEATRHKRYLLRLELHNPYDKELLVILKNPSRANSTVSDKTVFNICNYIYRNKCGHEALQQVGRISIVNLMPHYLTDSNLLHTQKEGLMDSKNFETIDTLCRQITTVIIAWGNAPKGLDQTYKRMTSKVLTILGTRQNRVYCVKQLSAAGHPRHGQIWAYTDPLIPYTL